MDSIRRARPRESPQYSDDVIEIEHEHADAKSLLLWSMRSSSVLVLGPGITPPVAQWHPPDSMQDAPRRGRPSHVSPSAPPLRSLVRRSVSRAWRFAVQALAWTGALSLVFHASFEVSRVTTSSMTPLLRGADQGEPDRLLLETRFTAGVAPSRRFDVVAYDDEDGVPVVKRVVGFPGEEVVVTRGGRLLIDGVDVPLPPGIGRGRGYLACGNLVRQRRFRVPAGHVYVLGDDSQDSNDSRFIGALPLARVRGRVLARVWPLSRAELL